MTPFTLETVGGRIFVSAEKYNYTLIYLPRELDPKGGKNMYFGVESEGCKFSITGRDLRSSDGYCGYSPDVCNLAQDPDPDWQYVEVGAGLGEFIPRLIENELWRKPIVIDPANYELMAEMLHFLAPQIDRPYHLAQLQALLERSQLMASSTNIKLLNMTLGEALRRHPEIREQADIVVDNYGPYYWTETEGSQAHQIHLLENQLLKEGGALYIRHFLHWKKIKGELERQYD